MLFQNLIPDEPWPHADNIDGYEMTGSEPSDAVAFETGEFGPPEGMGMNEELANVMSGTNGAVETTILSSAF